MMFENMQAQLIEAFSGWTTKRRRRMDTIHLSVLAGPAAGNSERADLTPP
jgi:hypothetical protein